MFRFWRLCFIKHAEARVEEMDSSMHGPWTQSSFPGKGLSGVSKHRFYNLFYSCFRLRWDREVSRSGTIVGTQWCPRSSPSPRLGRWSSGGHYIKASLHCQQRLPGPGHGEVCCRGQCALMEPALGRQRPPACSFWKNGLQLRSRLCLRQDQGSQTGVWSDPVWKLGFLDPV
jgi:hypothetical protein